MLYLTGILLLVGFAATSPTTKYEEGQVWRYNTREGEEDSRLYIARVDVVPSGDRIYHVFVDGVAIRHPLAEGGVETVLPHAAVGRETLDASVTELEQEGVAMPDISEGYAAWRKVFDAGKGIVYTVPVAEILNVYEDHIEDFYEEVLTH